MGDERVIDWGLLDDQIAVDDGRQPGLVGRDERQRRVTSLMGKILELADRLDISKTGLVKQLGIGRASLYRWRDGEDLPSTKNYIKLLKLLAHLEGLVRQYKA